MNLLSRVVRKIKTIRKDLERLRRNERFVSLNHFYSPLVNFDDKAQKQYDLLKKRQVLDIDFNLNGQEDLLNRMLELQSDIPWGEEPKEGLHYYFNNRNFAHADAITYFAMLRLYNPKQVIEVGSGYSSCVLVDSNKVFFDSSIKKTFIEPYPELLRKLLENDLSEDELIESELQGVDVSRFEDLEANDFLFIDSTHVSKFGSDVNYILFEILPRLKSGVIIHFHDIFNNFEYPKDWLSKGRSWNEDYILRAFLMNNADYRIIYFNDMMHEMHKETYEKKFSLATRNPGGSIWLQKTK